ncbi:hypothetical protein Gogos_010389 [Gossypium gossypioides]|uniref:Uncharacterized protein n=1 Tax=Gossypium gossypioides TaxID=34282 RepID=A0A7J9BL51_GOSGO|nr:hypothetical protein [Gossypium gossypioides]
MLKSVVRLLAELLWAFLGVLFLELLRIFVPSAQAS